MKSLLASVVGAGLLVAPVAAQAGTSAAAAVPSAVAGARASSTVGKSNKINGATTAVLVGAVLLGGAAAAGAFDGDKSNGGS